jgi:hypothetical protein
MSVTKYRDVSHMPPAGIAPSQSLARRIRAVWARARRLAPPCYRRGVQKFRTIQEAREARDQQTRRRTQQLVDRVVSSD